MRELVYKWTLILPNSPIIAMFGSEAVQEVAMPETGDAQPQAQNPAAAALQAKLKQGIALHRQGNLADAERCYGEVLQRQPDHFDALHLLGVIARQTRRTERGVELIKRAIGLNPKVAEAHNNLGNALRDLKCPAEALASYEKAIALKPDVAAVHSNRGDALMDLKRPEEALASYDKAIALKSDYAVAHYNRGNALMDLKRPAEALASYDRAIALKPDYAEAHSNRGAALKDLKRPEEALASYKRATALKPDFAEAHWNQSLCLLLMGHFEQGLRQYEWRKKLNEPMGVRSYPKPVWLGEESIVGKTMFVYREQGLGDTIQFCRYAKLVEARGAKVIMSVQQPLCGMLQQISPTIRILKSNEEPTDFDYHCPLLSLPLALRTTLETIPREQQYLKSDEQLRSIWSARLPPKTKPRVGVVWSGNPVNTRDHLPFNGTATVCYNFQSRCRVDMSAKRNQ